MYLETLLKSLVEMFLLIALGFFIRKRNLVDESTVSDVSSVLLSVILPFSFLASGGESCTSEQMRNVGLSFVIISLYYILAFAVSIVFFRNTVKDEEKRVACVNMSVFANTSFIGIPLAKVTFGAEGVIYAVVYNLVYNVFMFTLGVRLFDKSRKSVKETLKDMFLDPLSISSVAAIILFLLPWKLPSVIQNFLTVTGDISTPLSMMIIGSWLVGIDIRKILMRGTSYLVAIMRLVLLPLLVYLMLLPFHLDDALVGTVILLSAVPVGALNVFLSEKYGRDRAFVNETMLLTLCLSLVTIPLVAMIL